MFQFQTGSIRRSLPYYAVRVRPVFQFQTGSIRSEGFLNHPYYEKSFNSKLVRLEDTETPIRYTQPYTRFNSKLVRLEVVMN